MNLAKAVLTREIIQEKAVCNALGVVVFVLLTVFGAFIRIPLPFTPVPITAQTFFVLLSGLCLGARLGILSQFIYVLLGTMGLPVFSGGGSGILHLLGPTGGYLIGFCFGSFVTGFLARFKKDSFVWVVFSVIVGCIFIYVTGVLHLAFLLGIGIKKVFYLGVLPFMIAEILKILLASSIYIKLKTRTNSVFCI